MTPGATASGFRTQRLGWLGSRCLRHLASVLWILVSHDIVGWGAEIVLPSYFGDNMVVPSTGDPFVIWGWSDQDSGRIEIQGRTANWRRTKRVPDRGSLKTWEARIEGLTRSPKETLKIVAGDSSLFGGFEARRTLELTNVAIGHVWLWFVIDDSRAPKASLSPAQTNGLWNGIRVLRTTSPDALSGWPEAASPAWTRARVEDLPAGVSYFGVRPEVVGDVPATGIVLMPARSQVDRRLWDQLDQTPAVPDPRKDPIEHALLAIREQVEQTFLRFDRRRRAEINQLKLQGIVTNSNRLVVGEMLDFKNVRFTTPPELLPLRLNGVLW